MSRLRGSDDLERDFLGGVGARRNGEAFGADYELPDFTAYNETCAAVANAFWQQRLFLLHRDAKYIDVLERVLCNGVLGGVSLSGDRFFYTNVLESDGAPSRSKPMPWFTWPCCPTNITRLMPSIPGYIYATGSDVAYVNLFVGGSADLKLGEGGTAKAVRLTQQTRYPWEGQIRLTISPSVPSDFTLNVRIPGWAQDKPVPGDLYRYAEQAPAFTLRPNGKPVSPQIQKGYAVIHRTWKSGDEVELNLPMPVHRVHANEGVAADRGRAALERGPLVYCAEGIDNGGQARTLALPAEAEFVAEPHKDLLGGVTVIRAKSPSGFSLTAVPYYAWSNRGESEMCIWLQSK